MEHQPVVLADRELLRQHRDGIHVATIKREIRHLRGPWADLTRSQMRTILFAYIETFHNRQRHQARLDHRTPTEAYTAATSAAELNITVSKIPGQLQWETSSLMSARSGFLGLFDRVV
ncbi:MAG: hypothetical protein ACR2OH_06740 [Microthrixaceae bacterium]